MFSWCTRRVCMKRRGQVVIEIIWACLFISVFLASILFFYNQAEKEVQKIRKGESVRYE